MQLEWGLSCMSEYVLKVARGAEETCGSVEVEFTGEATKKILEYATELYDLFFYDEIPLVSIDMKWKLARLSASLAFLTLSTYDTLIKL